MTTVITYGTYDLLHRGHIALLERAKKLGDRLIVGVTSDRFDQERGKLNVQQSTLERVAAIKETGLADLVIVEEYEGQKISDIVKFGVDVFAIGSDWLGKFDYLKEYCEVVYLERTKGVSSTQLRTASSPIVKIGVRGSNGDSMRFIRETRYVSGVEAVCVNAKDHDYSAIDDSIVAICDDLEDFYQDINAVAIYETPEKHFDMVMEALNRGCNVLCHYPMFMSKGEAEKAFALAEEKGLVLFEAVKSLYFPAFEHLLLLIASGVIGEVKCVDVSCSQVPDGFDPHTAAKAEGALLDWGGLAMMPILKILGTDYSDISYFCHTEGNVDVFSHCIFRYPNAIAEFKVGKGLKTEGDMVITGTKGFIYVASPWWLTDYFEIRYEDLRNTRREFYRYAGEGLRYSALEFIRTVNSPAIEHRFYSRSEIISEASVLETVLNEF